MCEITELTIISKPLHTVIINYHCILTLHIDIACWHCILTLFALMFQFLKTFMKLFFFCFGVVPNSLNNSKIYDICYQIDQTSVPLISISGLVFIERRDWWYPRRTHVHVTTNSSLMTYSWALLRNLNILNWRMYK